jgi:UDP-GlcNAc:undecaprenyl-phosphate GlcNAc-1-phosphate transferase
MRSGGASLILLAAASAALCALLVPLVRRWAIARGIVDLPDERRIHKAPCPRLGGVAVFATVALFCSVLALAHHKLQAAAEVNPGGIYGFALGALIVFATGVVDDVRGLRPAIKLAADTIAAALVVTSGACLATRVSLPHGGTFELGRLAVPLTIGWIVLVTNAVNLLDGMDGLASGVVAIALATTVFLAGPEHPSVAIVATIIIGALAGFLVHNAHPATIFLGDSGSLFLGFSLAVLSTYAKSKASTGMLTLVPVLLVGLPISDALFAVLRRYAHGLVPASARSHAAAVGRIFVPDRSHVHHRLLRAGLSQHQAAALLYAIQAFACLLAVYVTLVWGTRADEVSSVDLGPLAPATARAEETGRG